MPQNTGNALLDLDGLLLGKVFKYDVQKFVYESSQSLF